MAVVLANGYGGTLFSFLSVSKLEQPINSMQELANSKDVMIAVIDRSELANRIMVYSFLTTYNRVKLLTKCIL